VAKSLGPEVATIHEKPITNTIIAQYSG